MRPGFGKRERERAREEMVCPEKVAFVAAGQREAHGLDETLHHRIEVPGHQDAAELRRVVHFGDQRKIALPAGPATRRAVQQRVRERVDDGLEVRCATPARGQDCVEARETLRVEVGRPPQEHGLEHALLAAEVIVRQRNVHVGGTGDVTHRHAVKAPSRKEPLRGVEDPVARRPRALRATTLAGGRIAASLARRRHDVVAPRQKRAASRRPCCAILSKRGAVCNAC